MRGAALLRHCTVIAMMTAVTARSVADAGTEFAIPAGQEPLVLEMLGGSDKLAGGCELGNASIRSDEIDASYTCAGAKKRLRLQHVSRAETGAKKTASFALATVDPKEALPGATVDALVARIREREPKFQWQQLAQPKTAPPPAPAASASAAPTPFPPEDAAAYAKGLDLYRSHKDREAFEVYMQLARKNPRQSGVLGMVVATLARRGSTASEVAALGAAADSAPDDPLKQFIAGVAAHYFAHNDAASAEEKRTYYTTALRYLDRAKAFDFEARWYIYQAVSHFRLGHQDEAETFIEKAVALGADDPDVYYCRAEIFQRKNIPRALEDIRTYQRMIRAIVQSTGIQSPDKERRVQMMYDHLLAVSRGEVSSKELFDPVSADAKYRRLYYEVVRRPPLFAATIGIFAALGFVGFRIVRRRRLAKT